MTATKDFAETVATDCKLTRYAMLVLDYIAAHAVEAHRVMIPIAAIPVDLDLDARRVEIALRHLESEGLISRWGKDSEQAVCLSPLAAYRLKVRLYAPKNSIRWIGIGAGKPPRIKINRDLDELPSAADMEECEHVEFKTFEDSETRKSGDQIPWKFVGADKPWSRAKPGDPCPYCPGIELKRGEACLYCLRCFNDADIKMGRRCRDIAPKRKRLRRA